MQENIFKQRLYPHFYKQYNGNGSKKMPKWNLTDYQYCTIQIITKIRFIDLYPRNISGS